MIEYADQGDEVDARFTGALAWRTLQDLTERANQLFRRPDLPPAAREHLDAAYTALLDAADAFPEEARVPLAAPGASFSMGTDGVDEIDDPPTREVTA